MSLLEQELKKENRRAKIQTIILNSLYAAGALSMAVLAPNALVVLKQFSGNGSLKKNSRYAVKRTISRLVNIGLIKFSDHNGKKFVQLTEEGRRRVALLHAHKILIKKPKRWDGKWRIVIFDIHEYRKDVRDKLRRTIAHLGFFRLQDSVWVYPYDCEDLVVLLKADFKIGKDILYIIAQKIENDTSLKKHFEI